MDHSDELFFRYLRRPGKRRLASVVRAWHARVWQLAHRATRDREDASDICQDVFLKLLLDPPAPERVRSPGGYLAAAVLGRARRLWRSARRRTLREREVQARAGGPELSREDAEALHRAIARLPADLRLTVELHHFTGLTRREIAALVGLSERAVGQRLQRAHDELRAKLRSLAPLALCAPPGIEAEARPPPSLLPEILEIVRRGDALAAAGAEAAAGPMLGSSVGVKTAAAVAAMLLVTGGLVWFSMEQTAPGGDDVALGGREEPTGAGSSAAPLEPAAAAPAPEPADTGPSAAATAPPLASFRGIVLDEDERPIASARVHFSLKLTPERIADLGRRGYTGLEEGKRPYEALTDRNGEFLFSDLLPVSTYVWADKAGYHNDGAPEVVLQAGLEACRELRLYPLLRLRGQVVTEGGAPVPGAEVLICDFDLQDPPSDVKIEEPGWRSFTVFPADGTGVFDTGWCITRDGLGRPDETVVVARALGFAASEMPLPRSAFTENEAWIDVALGPEMPVSVVVRDLGGAPIAGASLRTAIHITDWGRPPWASAVTDSAGRARIEHLPTQRHRVTVEKEGYVSVETTLEPGASVDVPVTLEPFRAPAAKIEGTVIVLPEVPEALRAFLHMEVHLERRDPSGSFVLARPLRKEVDGDSTVRRYWPDRLGRYRLAYGVQGSDTRIETDEFEFTGTEDIAVELPVGRAMLAPFVAGRVVAAGSGEPLAGVAVWSWANRDRSRSRWQEGSTIVAKDGPARFLFPGRLAATASRAVETDAEGRFAFFFGGKRELNVSLGLARDRRRRGWCEEPVFEIHPATAIDDVELVVRDDWGTIEGQVLAAGGEPAAGELVAAYDGRDAPLAALTNLDGWFRFEYLRPGRYAIEPLGAARGFNEGTASYGVPEWQELPELPEPDEFFARSVAVRSDEVTRHDIDLGTRSLGAIEVQMGGELPHGATLRYGMVLGGYPRTTMPFGGERPLARAELTLSGLFPGRYLVWLESTDAESFTRWHRGAALAEAEAVVERARVSAVILEPPAGALIVPLDGAIVGILDGVVVAAVERRAYRTRAGESRWQTLGGYRIERRGGALVVRGVLPGDARVRAVAPGFAESFSEAVPVRAGEEVVAPPLRMERGREIHVRLERDDRRDPPAEVTFRVYRDGGERVACTLEAAGAEGVWTLSAFRPGQYSVRAEAVDEREHGERLDGQATVGVGTDGDVEVTVRL